MRMGAERRFAPLLRIYCPREFEEVPDKVPNKVPNKSELSILRLLADNPRLTRVELAEKVGITENGVKRIITKMKAAGWIERMGSNKTGYWIVQYSLNN